MADDPGKDRPSLEPPSLAPPSIFRRRKKEPAEAAPNPAAPVTAEPVAEPVDETTVVPASAVPDAEVEVETEPQARPEPVMVAAAPLAIPAAPEEQMPRQPWLTGRLAAVVTGLVVGILVVVATLVGGHLCSAVKGTSSCGGSGFFLLLAILIGGVVVGAAMLRAAQEPGPGSTSVLAVGLLSVLTLVFLVGSIFEWWMIIAIPLFSMATFALSHWVTTAVVDDDRIPGVR